MTREEAKDVFLNRGYVEVENCRGRIFNADKWREACIVISEWLKEEPVIDKIRAEIKSYSGFELGDGFRDGYNTAMVRVLNILDKHKADVEPQESEDKE